MLRALLLMCLMTTAQGQTLLVGVSKFTPQSDGVWYQKAFPYTLNMGSASVGLRYDTTPKNGLSYSVGYMNLGKVSSSAIATGVDGDKGQPNGYNPDVPGNCNGGNCGYLSHWYGNGGVQGLYGSAVKHLKPWAVEAGLYLYRPTWEMHIPDWVGECRTCAPQDVRVGGTGKLRLGPMFGLRYQPDKWSLNLSAWHTTSDGEYASIYHNLTYNLSVGYSF